MWRVSEPLILEHDDDFDQVIIEIMIVEYRNNFYENKCKSRDRFWKIMKDARYVYFETVVNNNWDLLIHSCVKYLERVKDLYYVVIDTWST